MSRDVLIFMTLFAFTLSHAARAELLSTVEVTFILFVLVSFICVSVYGAKQIRAGRLFTSENAPLPLIVQPTAGWFYVGTVMALIFLQSVVSNMADVYVVLVLVGIAAALAENGRTMRTQFGFDRVKPVKALTWSLLICGGFLLIEYPLTELSTRMLDSWNVPHPEQQSVETFRQFSHPSEIFWFMLVAVVLVPIIEEFFFRGFLLAFLKNYTSIWPAIIFSGGVFAFAHLNLNAVLPLWFLGIVLGIAYEHTGSLLVPMGIHACFNLATGLSLLMDKGNPS